MVNYINHNGKKTAVINIIVDPQKGFHDINMAHGGTGGSLYVPEGEDIVAPIGRLIKETKDGIFLISNDWHPANHIADMTNHPGVMEYRKSLVDGSEADALNPVKLPFSELVLDRNGFIIGLKEGDRVRKVVVKTKDGQPPSEDDKGRVSKVLDEYLPDKFTEITGASTQMLWTPHCRQGTESARMPEGLNLPKELLEKLDGDWTKLVVHHKDAESGNEFTVIRKGTNSERDSNGFLVENDRTTFTPAMGVFQDLAKRFRADGVQHVVMNFAGLATNFCVEFSANQVGAVGAGLFKIAEMGTELTLAEEASRGIPIPGGKNDAFSLAGTLPRLQEKWGFKSTTIDQILAMQNEKPWPQIAGDLHAEGGTKQHERT